MQADQDILSFSLGRQLAILRTGNCRTELLWSKIQNKGFVEIKNVDLNWRYWAGKIKLPTWWKFIKISWPACKALVCNCLICFSLLTSWRCSTLAGRSVWCAWPQGDPGTETRLVWCAWPEQIYVFRPRITWLKDGIELASFSEHEHVSC